MVRKSPVANQPASQNDAANVSADHRPMPEPPLTCKEAAAMLSVSTCTVRRMVGLVWITYQATGSRPIRRITRESVRRLLERRSG